MGLLDFHLFLVKSGIGTEVLLRLMDFSESGLITLKLAASYTSMGSDTLRFKASTNALTIKKSIPPWPEPAA